MTTEQKIKILHTAFCIAKGSDQAMHHITMFIILHCRKCFSVLQRVQNLTETLNINLTVGTAEGVTVKPV